MTDTTALAPSFRLGRDARRCGGDHAITRGCRAAQRGGALVIVLFLSISALALGLLSAVSARTELRIAHNDVLDLQAFNIAEAGINVAVKQIGNHAVFNDELASNPAGGACTSNGVGNASSGIANIGSAATNASDGLCYRFASFGGTSTDGYYVRVTDNLDETLGGDVPTADTDGIIRLIVHGKIGTAERIIAGTLTYSGYGVFGINGVDLQGGNAEICSGNVSSCATGSSSARVGSNAAITGSGGATIMGSAFAGTTVSTSGLNVTGTSANNQASQSYPSVTACGPPYSSTAGMTTDSHTTYSATGASAGVLREDGGGTLTLAPGTYCFKTLTISGATLSVSGATTINLTGDGASPPFVANISGGGLVNTTNNPNNLTIKSSASMTLPGTCPTCFLLSGGSGTYATFYAPNMDIQFTGGGTIRGSLLGGQVHLSGNSNVVQYGVSGAKLSNWHEVQN
jgi:hypothetical protein